MHRPSARLLLMSMLLLSLRACTPFFLLPSRPSLRSLPASPSSTAPRLPGTLSHSVTSLPSSADSTTTTTTTLPPNIILYDGVCNFCNAWVDLLLVLDRSSPPLFYFAPLQSSTGAALLTEIGKEPGDLSSVVLVSRSSPSSPPSSYSKSSAVTQVLKLLRFPVLSPAAVLLSSLLPMNAKDKAYDVVARNRLRFLGSRSTIDRLGDRNEDRFLS
jgi:predicted DCC family thiol-disulfide oxidoreductase YuxK